MITPDEFEKILRDIRRQATKAEERMFQKHGKALDGLKVSQNIPTRDKRQREAIAKAERETRE
jgi:hypothetical protein